MPNFNDFSFLSADGETAVCGRKCVPGTDRAFRSMPDRIKKEERMIRGL